VGYEIRAAKWLQKWPDLGFLMIRFQAILSRIYSHIFSLAAGSGS
jgi:hypothetical protein